MPSHGVRPRSILVLLAVTRCSLLACSGGNPAPDAGPAADSGQADGGQPDGGSAAITVTAVLKGGAAATDAGSDAGPGPLAGDQLYCVNFATPPVAGSGTADGAGRVTFTFASRNTAFGCFVLDAAGNAVAPVLFTSGGTTGQTVALSSSTDLGTVAVGATGVAMATLAAGTVAPATSACPGGTWTAPEGTSACGNSLITLWTAAAPNGKYLASLSAGPKSVGGPGVCGYGIQGIDNAGTYAGGVLTFAISDEPNRPGCYSFLTVVGTPDATCRTMSVTGSLNNCGPCKTLPDGGPRADCTGCGPNTCTGPAPNLTRQ